MFPFAYSEATVRRDYVKSNFELESEIDLLNNCVGKMSLKVGNNFKIVHEEDDSVKQASSLESKLKLF